MTRRPEGHSERDGPRRGPDLAGRLRADPEVLARRIFEEMKVQVPVVAGMDDDHQAEVLWFCGEHVRLFFRQLSSGGRPQADDLEPFRRAAARRAEEGVPLAVLLASYNLGVRVVWSAMQEEARPDETDELIDLATKLLSYLHSVTVAGAAAYLQERQAIYASERSARGAVASALLAGDPAHAPADRIGLRLAADYVVLALHVDRQPLADGAEEGVEGHRLARALEDALSAHSGGGALTLLTAEGGVALLPDTSPPTPVPAHDSDGTHFIDATDVEDVGDVGDDHLERLVAELSNAARADVVAAAACHPGLAGVARSGREARRVLDLVLALGPRPGLHRLDDVLLESLVVTPDEASQRLCALLLPLEAKPDLMRTLEEYFNADFDRRQTAQALGIHPNTLDYRMRRIDVLLGLDVAESQGRQLLGAALTARRMAGVTTT